jgi:hypothetical protein
MQAAGGGAVAGGERAAAARGGELAGEPDYGLQGTVRRAAST